MSMNAEETLELAEEIAAARQEANDLLMVLDELDLPVTAMTLLAAAVQEYRDVCAINHTLPDTAEEFAKNVMAMAKALAYVDYTLAPAVPTMANFDDLPKGAFVVPGPVEPQ